MDVVRDVIAERSVGLAEKLTGLAAEIERTRLGVSTAALAEAARRRCIPVRRVGELSLLRLGYGSHRRLVWAALTDQTSAVGVDIACDKVLAKHAMRDAGIPTPDFYAFNETAFKELGAAGALPEIEERLDFPIVVKPASQGSALGIKFAGTAADVPTALVAAFSYGDKVLLERHVAGRDLAVSVLEREGGPEALPVVEAVPHDEDFYDFEARYVIGRTEFKASVAGRVTYHDSCHLLRGLHESATPRAILRKLVGAELVELGGADECCGFGGSFAVRLPEVSSQILDKKLANIEATGAACVVACDAGCLMQMGGGLRRRGSRVRALHLAELIGGEGT